MNIPEQILRRLDKTGQSRNKLAMKSEMPFGRLSRILTSGHAKTDALTSIAAGLTELGVPTTVADLVSEDDGPAGT